MRATTFWGLFLSWLVLIPDAQAAAPLADRAPADSLIYIGWAGADPLKPTYDQSHLAAVVHQSNLPQLADEYLPKFWAQMSPNGANDPQAAAMQKIVSIFWHHPAAWYMQPLAQPVAQNSEPHTGFICDAGADATALAEELRKMGPRALGRDTRVTINGTVVTMTSEGAPPPAGLANDATFTATIEHVQAAPALCVYVNAKGTIDMVNQVATLNRQAKIFWPKVRDALGLTNLQTFARTTGFEGKDWGDAGYLAAPMPRTGLLTVIEPHPIDPALLARIPATASSLSVMDFDATKLFDVLHDAFVAGGTEREFNQGSGVISAMLGRNLRRQLLAPLGGQWVMYSTADSGGSVLLNKVSDEKAAQDSITSAIYGICNLINTQIGKRGDPPLVTASQTQEGGLTVTTVTAKMFSPSFAIKDGILYFGMNAEAVTKAAAAPDTTGKEATKLEAFVAAQQRVGGDSTLSNFGFANLPVTAPAAHANVNSGIQKLREIAAGDGVTLPEIKLPTVEQLAPNLSPAMSLRWSDDAGLYAKSVSPFPLSRALLGDSQAAMVSSGAVAAAMSVALPALHRSRMVAQRVQCASNIRQILMGILMYANDHKGQYPPDLGTLLNSGVLTIDVFVCGSGKTAIPPEIRNAPKDQQAAWVNEHTDYIYHGKGQDAKRIKPMTPVISEHEVDHAPDGMNIGFGDGHVEWQNLAQAKKLIGNAPDAGEQGL